MTVLTVYQPECQTIMISDEAPHFVGPPLDPICLQRSSKVINILQPILYGILPYWLIIIFYKDANRPELRSGPTFVGPDLSTSLFVSKMILFFNS